MIASPEPPVDQRGEPTSDSVSVADRRQSFGAVARAYDRHRPGYPAEFIAHLLRRAEVEAEHLVLDLGAGTGQLAKRVLELGFEAVGVEPDHRMRAVLAENIGDERAHRGSAEAIPLPDASVQAVVAGQMWHWVDPARAVPEVGRVVRPGGTLIVLWILRDDRVPWIKRLVARVSVPDPYQQFNDASVPEFGEPFGPREAFEFEFTHTLTDEEFIAGLTTVSSVALAPDRDEQLERARQMLVDDPDIGGAAEVHIPYVCKAFAAVRS